MKHNITARMPVIDVDGTLVVMVVGSPEAAFGDEISLTTKNPPRQYPTLHVQGVDNLPASEIVDEVLDLFGLLSTTELVAGLSRVYGTGYGAHVPVTIYTLTESKFYSGPSEVTTGVNVADESDPAIAITDWRFEAAAEIQRTKLLQANALIVDENNHPDDVLLSHAGMVPIFRRKAE